MSAIAARQLRDLWNRTSGTDEARARELVTLIAGVPTLRASLTADRVRDHIAAGRFDSIPRMFEQETSSTRRHDPAQDGRRGAAGFLSLHQTTLQPAVTAARKTWLDPERELEAVISELAPLAAHLAQARRQGAPEPSNAHGQLLNVIADIRHPDVERWVSGVLTRGALADVLCVHEARANLEALIATYGETLPELRALDLTAWTNDANSRQWVQEAIALADDALGAGRYEHAEAYRRLARHLGGDVHQVFLPPRIYRPVDVDALIAKGRALLSPECRQAVADFGAALARRSGENPPSQTSIMALQHAEEAVAPHMWALRELIHAKSGVDRATARVLAASIEISREVRLQHTDALIALTDVLRLLGGRGIGALRRITAELDSAGAERKEHRLDLGRSFDPARARRDTFHEVAHYAEYPDPALRAALTAWMKRRAAGRPLISLRDAGYTDDGMAYDGGFFIRYVGLIYPDGSTEVLSTGMECFVHPEKMAELCAKDEEHFALILGWLT